MYIEMWLNFAEDGLKETETYELKTKIIISSYKYQK